ncbi:MAG: hypothetical protein HP055_04585 [Dialister sp.]|nr:hypothetical protein [Dialister sp.]
MIYIQIFLPAILSLAAFLMMLKFGLNKSGIFIAALCAMAVYLLAESRVSFASAVNGTALTFVLIYAAILLAGVYQRRKKEKNHD